MVASHRPLVAVATERGAEWLGQGESRRKTLPRTSAQSPRQLERVTLSLSLSFSFTSISPSVSLQPPVPPSRRPPPPPHPPPTSLRTLASFPPVLPRLRTFPPGRHPPLAVSSSSFPLPLAARFLLPPLPITLPSL